jgi:hypothetical protein
LHLNSLGEKTTMNPHATRKPSLYEQLMALPEGLTGEIIMGVTRRPLITTIGLGSACQGTP